MQAKQYIFFGDYKKQMESYVTELEANVHAMTREERMQEIETLTDAYVAQTGKRPDVSVLERLANVTLHEELSDTHPDKITRNEYPILSERQYNLRAKGKKRERTKAGVVHTEVPITHGSNVATDGTDYTPHKRSFNNPW